MRILFGSAILMVFLTVPMVHAEDMALSDRQIQTIKANCVQAQSSLKQLQLTEAATRNNRGRSYESISKLMTTLNGRIVLNKLTAPTLTAASSDMEKRFTSFKNNYDSYYDSVTATIKLSCKDQPVTFYDSLTNVRELRARVAQDIKSINESLDAYQGGINDELRAEVVASRSSQ